MQLETLKTLAEKFQNDLPTTVKGDLRDVEILLANNPDEARAALCTLLNESADPEVRKQINADVPADCKGIFLGEPREVEAATDEEGDETVTLPEGIVVLVASNIADATEAAIVLLHETGHALGMSEEEVAALGLSSVPKGDAPPPAA